MKNVKWCLLVFAVLAVSLVSGCEQKKERDDMSLVLPLNLSAEGSMNLQGPILQNVFAYAAWVKANSVSGLVIEGYAGYMNESDKKAERADICAGMMRSLFVTQGIAENRIKIVIPDTESNNETARAALESGDYNCVVVVRVDDE